jgi:hypothetical protein
MGTSPITERCMKMKFVVFCFGFPPFLSKGFQNDSTMTSENLAYFLNHVHIGRIFVELNLQILVFGLLGLRTSGPSDWLTFGLVGGHRHHCQ